MYLLRVAVPHVQCVIPCIYMGKSSPEVNFFLKWMMWTYGSVISMPNANKGGKLKKTEHSHS